MADFAIRFADFSGGDWGITDPSKVKANQFTGLNMNEYRTSLLGPRAGAKVLAATGLPTATAIGAPYGFDTFQDKLVIVVGSTPYLVPMTPTPAAVALANYPAAPTGPVRFVRGNGQLYSLNNGVLYKHTGAAGTPPGACTPITTPQPLSLVTRWGLFFVGVDRGTPWRIWFSLVDAAGPNFDSWPANNYLDVGNTDAITTLMPIFNLLYAGKAQGWFAVSGVLGTLASIREVSIGNGPVDQRMASVTTDNRIVYWPVEQVPAFWNGERTQLVEAQRMAPRNLPFNADAVITTPTARRIIMAGDDGTGTPLWTFKDSTWTHHRFAGRLAGMTPSDVKSGYQMPEHVVFAAQRAAFIGDPTKIWALNHDLDRPALASDTWASPIDDLATSPVQGAVQLPAWYDGQGRQVRVRSIVVQFRKWNGGVAADNTIRCAVDALGAYGKGLVTGEPHEWREPMSRASTAGTDDSWRFNAGDQGWANGFQIRLDQISGAAIREVVVMVDVGGGRN